MAEWPMAPWSVDWWIGADDRWHVPAREPSVRQRRIGHGPIIETSLRVPSGDVIHTAYPAVVDGRTVTVIEITNDSPVPVALALAIRPYSVAGDGDAGPGRAASGPRLELGGEVVLVDGRPAVRLPRRPNEAGASMEDDLLDAVQRGAELTWPTGLAGPSVNAVCLYPLPHRTSLRFVVDPGGPADRGATVPDPATLPDSGSAASGWTSIVDRAARFEFPDPGITALAGAARARLIMAAEELPAAIAGGRPGTGPPLEGLAIGGHSFECRRALEAFAATFLTELPATPDDAVRLIDGVGLAAELVADRSLAQALLEPLAQLVHLVERAAGVRPGVLGALRRRSSAAGADPMSTDSASIGARAALARVVALAGQDDAAADLLDGFTDPSPVSLTALTGLVEEAAPARRWSGSGLGGLGGLGGGGPVEDSVEQAAEFWIGARSLLVRERRAGAEQGDRPDHGDQPERSSPIIELLPEFPSAWRGGPVEVHRAPVAGYRLSFAIRWHGYRPALLWDLEPGDAQPGDSQTNDARPGGTEAGGTGAAPTVRTPRLTCPGLDADWHTDQPKGETLLAGSADELPQAPAPGDSFL